MKNEFEAYLKEIGIDELFLERAKHVYSFYESIIPEEIKSIFVTDYFDKDGNRQYENFWLFSETAVMEAKDFLNTEDFDYAVFSKKIHYWSIKKTEFDFVKASDKSRMTLEISLDHHTKCVFRASKRNCDYLKMVFDSYVFKNISL